MNLKIYFDGACGPKNPGGTASYGFAITDEGDNLLDSGHGIIGSGPGMTNNIAEHYALVKAFEAFISFVNRAKLAKCTLSVFGDSQLVIKQMNGAYRIREDRPKPYQIYARQNLVLRDRIRKGGVPVSFTWIPRDENQICDDLSKIDQIDVDKFPENLYNK